MLHKVNDWKEVSDGFYEKAIVLSLLLVLFMTLTLPHFETKPYTKIPELVPITFTPQAPKKVIPKPETIKPHIVINFEDDISEDEIDIEILTTIPSTKLEDYIVETNEEARIFNIYEVAPVLEKQVPAIYPQFMKDMQIEGTVHLEAIISESGDVISVKVLSSVFPGEGGLDEAAIAAVKQWKFQPATSGNNPVKCRVSLPITFQLQ